ncbi:MAG: nitrous oxide reductase family maturation protein NosD [Salibacteraceae bacterium]
MKNFLVLSLILVNGIFGFSKTIEVCATCPTKTLKQAFSLTQNGDEVILKPGVYKEHDIEIFQGVTLKGEGNPIIDGEMAGTILTIHADSFSIEGITFKNVGQSYTKDFAAILVKRAKHFRINNNILENVFFGILVEKSKYGEIYNNTISGERMKESNSGNGVQLWHSSNMEIYGNEVYGMRDGLYFEFVDNANIYNNNSHHNIRYGLHFMFSNDDTYSNNRFSNNGAGVAVMFSKKIIMHHNVFELNWGAASYGLLLKEIYDAEIHDNIFEQNTTGINTEGSTRINYHRNVFLRNGWAVKVTGGCYENIFTENDFSHNAFDLSFDGHLNGSYFKNNFWSEYTGYDLDKNGIGDVPYRPVKLFSYVVNKTPETIVLLRSLFVDIINFSEKVSPVFTPDNLVDEEPMMKRPIIKIGNL